MSDLRVAAAREVEEFHTALARWLADGEPRDMDYIAARLHPELELIDIAGRSMSRRSLVAGLKGAGGQRPGLSISIEGASVVWDRGGAVLVTFTEVHSHRGEVQERRTTALLTRASAAEELLLWRHVHETLLTPATRGSAPA